MINKDPNDHELGGKRTSRFSTGRLADVGEMKRIHHAQEGERDTNYVRSKLFLTFGCFPTWSGISGRRIET